MVSHTDDLKKIEKLERKEKNDENKIVGDEYQVRQIVRIIMFLTAAVTLFIMFGVFVYRNDFGLLPTKTIKYTPQCNLGSIQNCTTSGGCNGTRQCVTGEWTGCMVKQVCVPGSVKPCSVHNYGCINGVSVCDHCGTGFSECERSSANATNTTNTTTGSTQ